MEVRNINESDDRQAISRIYEESWKYAYRGIIPQDYLDAIPAGRWVNRINDPNMHSVVLLDKEKAIGTSSFCESRIEEMRGHGEIVSIYLLPEYMGKGYGKLLLNADIEQLKELGYSEIFLWVLEENKRARAFYESFGFIKSEKILKETIGGKEITEVQYRYSIK